MLLTIASAGGAAAFNRGVVTVILIDSEVLLTDTLISIADSKSVQLACAASNLDDGLALLRRFRPQVLLVAGSILVEGIRALSDEVSIRLGETRVGVFADQLTDAQLSHALTLPLGGLFSKHASRSELLDGVLRMAHGQFFVAEPLRSRVTFVPGEKLPQLVSRQRVSKLTDRQLEVLVQLAGGDSVREIAERMHLSEKAVESHKFRIMSRLGISNRVQLCRWAIREGIITA
jgi:DNA-binding NarL/FixJ family response regulator